MRERQNDSEVGGDTVASRTMDEDLGMGMGRGLGMGLGLGLGFDLDLDRDGNGVGDGDGDSDARSTWSKVSGRRSLELMRRVAGRGAAGLGLGRGKDERAQREVGRLRERVSALEMTEMENGSLRDRIRELEWALDVVREDADRVREEALQVLQSREVRASGGLGGARRKRAVSSVEVMPSPTSVLVAL